MAKQKLVWRTERRKVKDLIRYEKNPRKLSDTQLDGLKRSLKKFNIAELPCMNTDGTLVAGNQRVLALSLLGREEELIEVRVPNRPLTEAEFRDYLLTSNRSGGSWDFEKLAAEFNLEELLTSGFDSIDLSNIFDDNLEIVDDEFDEAKELEEAQETDIKAGDYFSLGRHRLLCGDATNPETVKNLMGEQQVDLINDDLPFNIGLSYDKGVGNSSSYGGKTNDSKTDADYEQFVRTVMKNALTVAKSDAHVMFWCDERYVWLFQQIYRELNIDSKRLCIWIKDNHSPTPNVAFNKVTEFCVYGTIGKPYLNTALKNLNEIQNKEVTTGNRLTDDILDLFNIWLVKRIPGSEYEHPTQKNPTLHEKALRRCTKPGDIVLDLTAGSGSILSACEQLKRTAYLNELEPVFCQVIINRFKKISHEPVIKLN
ncbi:MAG: DNA modification methylase [Candidatus Pacebacteria bacterium]|nr:DNA modification methylase [Candidatus Paceibacterota bacterium]MCF7857519.1 DNA modification methylase [Candidatus Paceibacterota bacterium]